VRAKTNKKRNKRAQPWRPVKQKLSKDQEKKLEELMEGVTAPVGWMMRMVPMPNGRPIMQEVPHRHQYGEKEGVWILCKCLL